jgi:hypothetical protein
MGWRNSFLGINSGALWTFKNTGSAQSGWTIISGHRFKELELGPLSLLRFSWLRSGLALVGSKRRHKSTLQEQWMSSAGDSVLLTFTKYQLLNCLLRDSVARFFASGFFMNQFAPMQPQGIPLEPFRIFQKFAEIFACQGCTHRYQQHWWCTLSCEYLREYLPLNSQLSNLWEDRRYIYVPYYYGTNQASPLPLLQKWEGAGPRQHSSHCGSSHSW